MPTARTVRCDCGEQVDFQRLEVRYMKGTKEAHVWIILVPHKAGAKSKAHAGKPCFRLAHPFASWDHFGE